MITRNMESVLRQMAGSFKAVTITGPRQSGKTTLARMVFPDKPYLSLETPDVRRMALEDPRLLLGRHPAGCILDEVQRAPGLLSYLQEILDASSAPGRYILTGSQQFGLMEGITQSLAGRTGLLTLLPFAHDELERGGYASGTLEETLFKGGYPPLFDLGADPQQWLDGYLTTYVERDVRQALNVRDLTLFARFLALCAGSVGQLLNASRLGADCGLNHGTARQWLSVLEASYVVFRLAPHHRNFRKRLVKTPKLYFHDTGLVARLLGIEAPDQLLTHPLRGALFENWVVAELLKGRFNRGKKSNLYFWRDNVGLEVDVLMEAGGVLRPLEVKAGATLADDWLKSMAQWSALAGQRAAPGCLVYGGRDPWERGGVQIVPWRNVARLAAEI
ncbi:MAG: ATP-binding protein [Candidatus Marinimicrobia bacterium]|nr:ATP-binding protein [Candidatus Neomarinimicrobiota bacterium]